MTDRQENGDAMDNSKQEELSSDDVAPAGAHASPPGNDENSTQKPRRKRSRKKLWITLGIIAVALVGLFAGGWTWHEQPSFCNAICHQPMDSYVEGYYSGDATLLVAAHEEAGERCLTCHEPTIGEQLAEVGTWVTGAYQDPLPMTKTGTREFCLECHDSEEIKVATVNYGGSARNPHDSHYGDALECYTCHRVHRASVMYCNECHKDISGPAGWTS
jgi:hypothetical protein